ncbi:MAG: hypothetical protein AB1757_06840 [Acidobacteriota bacterium]
MDSEKQQIVKQARAEYDAGLQFRHQREAAWKLAEDQYFNKQTKSLKQRYNVPIPIVPGFVETLLSKIDDPPSLKFEQAEEADYKAAKKVQAFYEAESQNEDHDWDMIDLDAKKQAILYGRAIFKFWSESKPKYRSNLKVVDVYDFVADPIGGGDFNKHRFDYEDNLFKSREDLKEGVKERGYDKETVQKLINATSADKLVQNDNMYQSKQSRMMALGMDGITHNYAGQALYKLIEGFTTWNGVKQYVLFNYETGLGVKVCPLTEVFKSDLSPYPSWATHRDIFNFWSKAPVDDIVPLAEMARILVNQELDNRNKKNWGMRGYDTNLIADPAELNWRPDGLVKFKNVGAKRIQDGIYQFETPELNGTINLVQYIDNVIGQKTGVTADTQGQSSEDKVGIYYGNMQQVADRLGLYNKSYKKAWAAIGRRYLWGLFEHLRAPMAVRIIGEKGAEWDEIKRIEVNPNWNIRVEGGNAEMQADEVKKQRLKEIMEGLAEDELAITSPRWRAETKFRAGGVDEDEIRMAFDKENEGNREILAEASQMIQDCLASKPYKVNRGANTAFCQKILDYAIDTDLPMDKFNKLMEIVEVHLPIAQENAARKAVQMMAQRGAMPQPPSATEQLYGSPDAEDAPQSAPNTPGGTLSRSQQLSPEIAPQV